ncbi:MAG: hypothetical protein RIE73_29625 [Coleofasciculus sp. C1-SOL-03]
MARLEAGGSQNSTLPIAHCPLPIASPHHKTYSAAPNYGYSTGHDMTSAACLLLYTF